MLRILGMTWRSLGALTLLLGVFWMPNDTVEYDQAAQTWREMFAMIDQNTGLWIFAGLLLATLMWSDGRRVLHDRRKRRAERELTSFVENRSRFTIREAACIAVGVHPSEYEQSPAAQGEASEMIYYAGAGLLWPAELSSAQREMWRRTSKMPEGFRASLDTFITRDEMERHRTPGFKSWLPILDAQHKERS